MEKLKGKMLSTDFTVLVQIYEDNLKHIPSTYTRLKNVTWLSRKELDISLDRLYDSMMIDYKPTVIKNQIQQYFEEKVFNNKPTSNTIQCMSYYVGEGILPFVKGLYNCTQKVENEGVITRFMMPYSHKVGDNQTILDDFFESKQESSVKTL